MKGIKIFENWKIKINCLLFIFGFREKNLIVQPVRYFYIFTSIVSFIAADQLRFVVIGNLAIYEILQVCNIDKIEKLNIFLIPSFGC